MATVELSLPTPSEEEFPGSDTSHIPSPNLNSIPAKNDKSPKVFANQLGDKIPNLLFEVMRDAVLKMQSDDECFVKTIEKRGRQQS